MKLYYYSDLHLEFTNNNQYFHKLLRKLNPDSNDSILLLSGDITYLSMYKENYIIEELKKKFKAIYYIAGNHEFYDKVSKANILLDSFNVQTDNINFELKAPVWFLGAQKLASAVNSDAEGIL